VESQETRFRLGSLACLIALPLLTGGCASVFHGTRQKIEVFTDPPGATATTGGQRVTTPGVLRLPRKAKSTEIRIEKEGYAPRSVILQRRVSGLVWLNFVGIAAGASLGASIGESTSDDTGWFAGWDEAFEGALIGGAVVPGLGFAVDHANGAAYFLDPAKVVVRLEPAGAATRKAELR